MPAQSPASSSPRSSRSSPRHSSPWRANHRPSTPLDAGRFAAAHVLLTRIGGIEYQAGRTWDGLSVDIEPTDQVRFRPEERVH